MPSGGLANQRDAIRIDFEFRCVLADVLNRHFHIICRSGECKFRRETIVDADPGEVRLRQWSEQIIDVLLLVASDPAAAVNEDRSAKWAGPIRNVRVQQQMDAMGLPILHIFEFFSVRSINERGQYEQQKREFEEEAFRSEEFYNDASEFGQISEPG